MAIYVNSSSDPLRKLRQVECYERNLDASQSYIHSSDLITEAQMEIISIKLRAHLQVIKAANRFKEAPKPETLPPYGDFGIGHDPRLTFMTSGCNGATNNNDNEGSTDYSHWASWFSRGVRPKLVAPDIMVRLRTVLLILFVAGSGPNGGANASNEDTDGGSGGVIHASNNVTTVGWRVSRGSIATGSTCCSSCCHTAGGCSSSGISGGNGGTDGEANAWGPAGFASSSGSGTSAGGHGVFSVAGTSSGGAADHTFAVASGSAGGPYTIISIANSHPTPIRNAQESLHQFVLSLLCTGSAGGLGAMQIVDKQTTIYLRMLLYGINFSFGVCFLSACLAAFAMLTQHFRPPRGLQVDHSQLKGILKISTILSLMSMAVATSLVVCFNIGRQI
ncbi:hypothetical protein C5167_014716 [Papaver somniferum]|uniref:PGG domain-containing protein n=1 Tax=Papaver somniferum TaxID=3469 RepID=A0A4Y7J7G2_PAPSO|nr:hypothetical protein C5167_014716 [Papaver somniferum]